MCWAINWSLARLSFGRWLQISLESWSVLCPAQLSWSLSLSFSFHNRTSSITAKLRVRNISCWDCSDPPPPTRLPLPPCHSMFAFGANKLAADAEQQRKSIIRNCKCRHKCWWRQRRRRRQERQRQRQRRRRGIWQLARSSGVPRRKRKRIG